MIKNTPSDKVGLRKAAQQWIAIRWKYVTAMNPNMLPGDANFGNTGIAVPWRE